MSKIEFASRNIGKVMRFYRYSHGKTQRELADKLGTSISNISDIERGINFPNGHIIDKFLELSGLTPNQIYSDKICNFEHIIEEDPNK